MSAEPRGARRAERLALLLAVAVVGLEVTYPLLHGRALTGVTIATVLVFAAAAVASAVSALGGRAGARLVVVAAGIGLFAEAVGVRTGAPFGRYAYSADLGPQVAGVPLVVPAAWLMMAWPALVLGRRLAAAAGAHPRAAALPAAWALAAWDVFLDPQMVAAGHWRWASPDPGLPGVDGVPLTNAAGWLLVGLVLELALDAALPRARGGDAASGAAAGARAGAAVPLLLAWTWLGSALANAVFFGRPWVALWGFAALGLVVAPYLVLRARDLRRRGGTVPARVPGAPPGQGARVSAR